MNSFVKTIFRPLLWIRDRYEDRLRKTNPEKLFSIYFRRSTGKTLAIDKPKSLYDFIAYFEFRTDTSEWSRLADKVKVRDYVSDCGYGDFLPKLFGVWEHVEDVDFTILPNRFVIKTNNGSATNIIVKDKTKIDDNQTRSQLAEWLATDYGFLSCQPHYSRIPPLILAEEYLEDNETERTGKSLLDYKIYCVHGSPKYVFVYSDRVPNSHIMKRTVYDMEWNSHQEFLGRLAVPGSEVKKPESFELMREMAAKLSSPFPFVRVDFYEINGKPIFGEMTFTPGMQETSLTLLNMLGEQIRIN